MFKKLLAPGASATETLFKRIFIIATILLFIIRPVFLSSDYGPSSDEVYHKPIGEMSYTYLTTLGKNDTIFHYRANDRDDPTLLYNYGPLVDITATAVYKNLGTDPFNTRHFVISLFTFIFYLFCGLTAKRLAGGSWIAGCLGLLFAIIAPRLWGEGFNNPKDSTFAGFYIMSIYYIIAFADELPKPRWKTTLLLMLAIGLAFGIRVGALLLVFYLGMVLAWDILSNKEWRKQLFSFQKEFYKPLLIRLLVVFVGFWLIGISTWPAALRHPLTQPMEALNTFSKFPVIIKTLFEGVNMMSNEVPWYYTPLYILITTPVITLIGVGLGFLFLPLIKKVGLSNKRIAFLIFTFVFPLFYIAYSKSPLYNGWRHSYFAFGGIAVFAAVGYYVVAKYINTKWAWPAIGVVIAIGAFFPIRFMINSHPLEYVYINELKGGVSGSYGDFQIDYYAAGAKPAADWISKNVPYDSNIVIASNMPWEVEQIWQSTRSPWANKAKVKYIRFRERYDSDWDYAILDPQFVDPNILKNGLFVQKGTVYQVDVDGAPITLVVKRRNKNDFLGKEALDKQDIPKALVLLKDATTYDPNNEIAWTNYAQALMANRDPKAAIEAFKKAVNISPESMQANYGLGIAYLQSNDVQQGIIYMSRIIEANPQFAEPYRILATVYAQLGDNASAQRYMSYYQQLTGGGGQ